MELRDFIAKTLSDICVGIHDANKAMPRVGNLNDPMFELGTGQIETAIEFDVAVTVSSAETKGGKAGVQIAVVRAGIGGEKTETQEQVSRIKFRVFSNGTPDPEDRNFE